MFTAGTSGEMLRYTEGDRSKEAPDCEHKIKVYFLAIQIVTLIQKPGDLQSEKKVVGIDGVKGAKERAEESLTKEPLVRDMAILKPGESLNVCVPDGYYGFVMSVEETDKNIEMVESQKVENGQTVSVTAKGEFMIEN